MSVSKFRAALEDEIRRAAIEKRKYSIDRSELAELGKRVGLPEEVAVRLFLSLAGKVWAGEIMPGEGPPIFLYGPPQRRIDPNWLITIFDLVWMQRRGKIPYGDQLGG